MKQLFLLSALFCISFSASAQFAGGTGTSNDPYQIENAEQLQAVNDFLTSHFILTEDIDLEDVVWNPIGSFTGVFDGNGHSVNNLRIENGNSGNGLFTRMNTPGVIKNLTIKDAEIIAGNWSGILCGTNGNWEIQGGDIINCTIINSSIEGGENVGAISGVGGGNFDGCRVFNVKVEGTNYVGGISGDNEKGGYFKNNVFYGDVTSAGYAAGICAFYNGASRYDVAFENNVVYGNISSSTGTVGGILATPNWNSENAHIENCAVFATCSGQCVGSIGGNALRGRVQNCYATGDVKATGLWAHDQWQDSWNGGICAVNFNGPIMDCYFSGTISTSAEDVKIAGVCGRNWEGITVKNTYYNADGAPMGMGDGDNLSLYDAKEMLPEDMTKMSNFQFSDMAKWQNIYGKTTPFFANQTAPVEITSCTEVGIEGTCSDNLESLYLYGSLNESILEPVKIENGNWIVEFKKGDVTLTETISVIAFDRGKMPSMITKAKVKEATDINNVENSEDYSVDKIYNAAGQCINTPKAGHVNIIRYTNGKSAKMIK